jgi:hypothetical protein
MAILTTNHKVQLVNTFIDSIENSKNSYYCFVGRAEPWLDANGDVNEANVEIAVDSVSQNEQIVYTNMVYGKRLDSSDIIQMTKRYNWVNNSVYARYDNNDADLYTKNFYVITDTNDVYKCIHNGFSPSYPNGVPSVVKPSVRQTSGNFQTSDGYIWKYMFTCDSTDYVNFQTSNFIPVNPNTDVKDNAVPGTIDFITLSNAGNNYQIYEEDFLKGVVNNYVVQLPANSSVTDNIYVGSSIYLKAGSGAGQIRSVSSYDGLTKQLGVQPAFSYYENLKLSNTNGYFTLGDLVTQKTETITYLYNIGYFNVNDYLVQSDTASYLRIRQANTSTFLLENLNDVDLSANTPIFNTSETHEQKTGTVNITDNSIYVNSAVATAFTTDYSVNDYIRIGPDANNNVRRVVAVNSSVVTVNFPFAQSLTAANNYHVNNAITVDSITRHRATGSIVFTNLTSAQLNYSNVTPAGQSFIVGELIDIVDAANTSQGSNGIVSFSNASTLILTDVGGSITANYYVYGMTSKIKAYIDLADSRPNITVDTITGGFYTGVGVTTFYANSVPNGNAFVVSKEYSPNERTEYIISPKVDIEGDGNGAFAYCTVDLSSNNPNRSISSVVLIDGGSNYTRANVSVSANTLYGDGAIVEAQISPVNGHGYNPYQELASTYCGISKKFDTGINEGYTIPMYGSYRSIGVIKNPQIEDVIFEINNFDRAKLNIANTSGVFVLNEIVVQSSSNSAGVVAYTNSTFLELKNVKGTFTSSSNTANTLSVIYGWTSGANSHVTSANVSYFTVSNTSETIVDSATGASARITQVISNTQIRVSNVVGSFLDNDYIYEAASNSYANVSVIYTSNGKVDSTSNFGNKINQTARITLASNTKPFALYEYVTQDVTFATGRVISNVDELDIYYDTASAWAVGDIVVNDTTGSNAIITYANTTAQFLRISAVNNNGFNETTNRPFNIGDSVRNLSSTKNSTINTVYNVLILDDVNRIVSGNTTPFLGKFQVGSYEITGNTSGAAATVTLENSIKQPDFVRESGEVIYFENISKFDKTPNSTEQLKLIIKF